MIRFGYGQSFLVAIWLRRRFGYVLVLIWLRFGYGGRDCFGYGPIWEVFGYDLVTVGSYFGYDLVTHLLVTICWLARSLASGSGSNSTSGPT